MRKDVLLPVCVAFTMVGLSVGLWVHAEHAAASPEPQRTDHLTTLKSTLLGDITAYGIQVEAPEAPYRLVVNHIHIDAARPTAVDRIWVLNAISTELPRYPLKVIRASALRRIVVCDLLSVGGRIEPSWPVPSEHVLFVKGAISSPWVRGSVTPFHVAVYEMLVPGAIPEDAGVFGKWATTGIMPQVGAATSRVQAEIRRLGIHLGPSVVVGGNPKKKG